MAADHQEKDMFWTVNEIAFLTTTLPVFVSTWGNDMSLFDKGLITILFCNVIYSLVSVPLILRKVPRNRVYGYRTRTTLANDLLWYEANAYFGLRFLIGSILSACIAVALNLWRWILPATYLKVSILLLVAPAIISWLLTERYIRASGSRPV